MAVYTCPNCNAKVNDTEHSCSRCGTPIEEIRNSRKTDVLSHAEKRSRVNTVLVVMNILMAAVVTVLLKLTPG